LTGNLKNVMKNKIVVTILGGFDMAEFVPLEQITQMSDEERKFLEKCSVKTGYFDTETQAFVIRKFL
jgi:hypothetical protein